MASVEEIVTEMEADAETRFSNLYKVCEHYFGTPRNKGSSHYVFKMPWPGDPRVNIQNDGGKAKKYQVRQVLAAIAKLKDLQAAAAKLTAEKAEAEKLGKVVEPKDRKPPKKR